MAVIKNGIFATYNGQVVTPQSNTTISTPVFNFLQSTNITDFTQRNAIYNLVADFQSLGLWDKMKAIYPMVGGNANAHKYNLKDPTSYTVTWSGNIKHDSTGIEFLGGYGDTGFAPFTALTNPTQSSHISLYNNKLTLSASSWGLVNMGNSRYTDNGLSLVVDYVEFGQTKFNAYSPTSVTVSTGTWPNARLGLFVAARTDVSQSGYYQRGSRTINSTSTIGATATPNSSNIWLGGESGGAGWGARNSAMAFATIGDGLSQSDVDNYYTAVQRFQTTLGRQV
jgi:hypothetical protein